MRKGIQIITIIVLLTSLLHPAVHANAYSTNYSSYRNARQQEWNRYQNEKNESYNNNRDKSYAERRAEYDQIYQQHATNNDKIYQQYHNGVTDHSSSSYASPAPSTTTAGSNALIQTYPQPQTNTLTPEQAVNAAYSEYIKYGLDSASAMTHVNNNLQAFVTAQPLTVASIQAIVTTDLLGQEEAINHAQLTDEEAVGVAYNFYIENGWDSTSAFVSVNRILNRIVTLSPKTTTTVQSLVTADIETVYPDFDSFMASYNRNILDDLNQGATIYARLRMPNITGVKRTEVLDQLIERSAASLNMVPGNTKDPRISRRHMYGDSPKQGNIIQIDFILNDFIYSFKVGYKDKRDYLSMSINLK